MCLTKKYLCDMSTKPLVTIWKMSTKYQATGMICVKEKLKVVWQIESEYVSHGGLSGYQGDAAPDSDAGFSGRRSLIRVPPEY